jgi:hypothetical protein
MGTIAETDLKTQVCPVRENVAGPDTVIPVVLGDQFNGKWDIAQKGQLENAAMFFVGIKVHSAKPESLFVLQKPNSWLD